MADDIEVIEPGSNGFTFDKNSFSHEFCVFKSYSKVQEVLAKEMREGFIETRYDRQGNTITIFNPDTRREAIEAVTTLKNVMCADIQDHPVEENISEYLKIASEVYDDELKKQKSFYDSYKHSNKKKVEEYEPYIIIGTLYDKGPFYHNYLNRLVSIYRSIFEQLELCLATKQYFKRKKFGN